MSDLMGVGRVGKVYYLSGVQEDLRGPYRSHGDAEAVRKSILANFEKFEVIDRLVTKKPLNSKKKK